MLISSVCVRYIVGKEAVRIHGRVEVPFESSSYLQIVNKVLATMCLVLVFFALQNLCLVENLLIPCKDLLMNRYSSSSRKGYSSLSSSPIPSLGEGYGCDMIRELIRIRDHVELRFICIFNLLLILLYITLSLIEVFTNFFFSKLLGITIFVLNLV